jgi:hypothetical protein
MRRHMRVPDKAHPVPASHTRSTPHCRSRLVTASAGHAHSNTADALLRGSAFLKQWMEYLEENADLRYPNLADVYDEQ